MKEESVDKDREIAVTRETVSKMKREMEVEKNRKVHKANRLVQTDSTRLLAMGTQTTVRTCASVAAQVGEVRVWVRQLTRWI